MKQGMTVLAKVSSNLTDRPEEDRIMAITKIVLKLMEQNDR
jgi:hypothetical protein